MDEEIFTKVCEILVNEFFVDSSGLQASNYLVTDLDLDSLELLEFGSALEEHFGVEVNDEDLKGDKTVGEVVALIQARKTQ